MHNDYPYGHGDRVAGWLFAWFAMAATTLLLAAWAVDSRGAKDWNHREPLPAGVVQLSASDYLLTTESKVGPAQICRGTSSSNDTEPVNTKSISNAEIPALDEAIYAECDKDQTWSDAQPGSPNYGTALLRVMQSPFWIYPMTTWITLIGLWAGSVSLGVRNKRRRRYKEQRAAEEREKKFQVNALDARYKALRSSWASGEIDDLQFDSKLTELVEKGYELPDGDIFK